MRIGRGYPQQSFNAQGQALGPRQPATLRPPPVVTTLAVYDYAGAAASRSSLHGPRRFPLQGWGGAVSQDDPQDATPLLDDFNRPDENPLSDSGEWGKLKSSAPFLQVVAGAAVTTAAGQGLMYWKSLGQMTDCDVILSVDPSNGDSRIKARMTNVETTTYNGYGVRYVASTKQLIVDRNDAGGASQLGSVSLAVAPVAIGLRCEGNKLRIYTNFDPGVDPRQWRSNGFVTDSTYPSGYPGIGINDAVGGVAQVHDFRAMPFDGSPFGFSQVQTRGAFRRNLGVFPPVFTSRLPVVTTLAVSSVAVKTRRLSDQPRFPLQGWEGASGFLTDGSDGPEMVARNLGPRPPVVVDPSAPAAPPVVTTLLASVAVQARRLSEKRRYPLQGWEGVAVSLAAVGPVFPSFASSSRQIVNTTNLVATQFVPSVPNLVRVSAWLASVGSPTDITTISIQGDNLGAPDGSVIASSVLDNHSLTNLRTWFGFDIAATLIPGVPYWVVIQRSVSDASNFVTIAGSNGSAAVKNNDTGGTSKVSSDGGSTWPLPNPLAEFGFELIFTPGEFGMTSRFLGPRPPLVVASAKFIYYPVASFAQFLPVAVTTARRAPLAKSLLFPPQTLAQPPPVVTALTVSFVQAVQQARRVRQRSVLAAPTVVAAAFVAAPLAVALVENREHGVGRRAFPGSVLSPPRALQVFAAGRPTFARARPARTHRQLAAPAVVTVSTFVAEPVVVALVRVRPRATVARVSAPPVLQTFAAGLPHLNPIRPRPTSRFLGEPTVVRVPSVERAEQTIRTTLFRLRPRPTARLLGAPTVLQTFPAARVVLARIRPRPAARILGEPTVVRVPSVEQQEATVRVTLARIRPRPTIRTSARPTALQIFASGKPTVAVTRPRKTIGRLNPPTVLRVERQEDTIHAVTVTARPRPTSANLAPPTTLQVFAGPVVAITRGRPRKTAALLFAPTVLRIPSVEQREDTIFVALVRARPRPTVRELGSPTVLQVFAAAKVTLAQTRPRPTVASLTTPTVVRVPAVEQLEQTIRVALTRARPRPTLRRLRPPTVLRVPSVEQQEQTLRVRLAQTRPRPTSKRLAPPTVIVTNPPVVTDITVADVEPRNRRDWPRRFPLQGFRQRLVRETGSAAGITLQMRDPFLGPRPPQIVGPLPTPDQTKIVAKLALRRQVEDVRRKAHYALRPPTKVNPLPTLRMQTVGVTLARIRPRKTLSALFEPTVVTAAFFAEPLIVVQTRVRPRRTASLLGGPTVLQTFAGPEVTSTAVRAARPRPTAAALTAVSYPTTSEITVALAHVRPRRTIWLLRAPTALEVFAGPVEHEITVSAVLERRRHAPHSRLLPPTALAPVQTRPSVSLSRTRPRATLSILAAPTAVAATRAVQDTLRVALARIRPRRTVALILPSRVRPPVEIPISATFARVRPAATAARLAPPTRVRPQEAFLGPTTRLAPGRRPVARALLSPPTIVAAPAPPTPEQLRLLAALTSIQTRTRFRTGYHVLHPVLPPPLPPTFPRIPETTGYAASGADAPGEALTGADSTGQASPGTASQGAAVPVAESTGNAVPGTASDGG